MFGRLKEMFGGNSEEIKNALNNGASIIDVRSEAEYRGGHVAGSTNIPLQQLGSAMSKMPKDKPIVFCCASGRTERICYQHCPKNGV